MTAVHQTSSFQSELANPRERGGPSLELGESSESGWCLHSGGSGDRRRNQLGKGLDCVLSFNFRKYLNFPFEGELPM